MNLTEAQFKRYVQVIVVAAVTCLFTLGVTLVIQMAILTNQKKTLNNLEAAKTEYMKLKDEVDDDAKAMLEKDFIEKYAIKYHNKGTKGSIKFK